MQPRKEASKSCTDREVFCPRADFRARPQPELIPGGTGKYLPLLRLHGAVSRCQPGGIGLAIKTGAARSGRRNANRHTTAARCRTHEDRSTQKEEGMKNLFNRFVNEEAGQDLIEYALLAGLISLVCVLAITAAGTKVSTLFSNVSASIP